MRIGLRHKADDRFFPLGERALIGAAPGCDVLLEDEGVAPEHATIRITAIGIEIDDLGANTTVNAYPITKYFLSRNDELKLGNATLILELSAEDAPPAARCRRCGAEAKVSKSGSGVGTGPNLCTKCQTKTGSSSRTPTSKVGGVGGVVDENPIGVLADRGSTQRIKKMSLEAWLDDHDTLAILGEGSQGRVYKLRHKTTGRICAAKRLWTSGAKAVERFEREIEALRRLDHPSIVGLLEVRRTDSGAILLMEFVDGPSLSAIIKRDGRVDLQRALVLATRIAEGIAYGSQNRIVHRDVKPSNILVGPRDAAKLTDFGLVTFEETRTRLTADGQWIGTPHYMAPEQVEGAAVDGRTDVWGLGAAFFQAITGTLPFEASAPAELFKKITRTPVDMAKLKEIAGDAVVAVFTKLLAKKVDERLRPEQAALELGNLVKK